MNALPAHDDAALPESGADLSPCGRYRYRLWRRWSDAPHALWVMLNPSTADATKDDPTIRRCVSFARAWGCGGIVVVNLYAWRATNPEELWRVEREHGFDIVGPTNDATIAAAITEAHVGTRVAAWGTHARPDRVAAVHRMVVAADVEVVCLGRSRAGMPRHPLMVRRGTLREPYLWPPDQG